MTELEIQETKLACPAREPDKYDKAIALLTEHPEAIENSWSAPYLHPAGCLFALVAPEKRSTRAGRVCGCLTQIRQKNFNLVAWTDDLTNRIRNDDRLPGSVEEITIAHLPVFAEWQRRIDVELRRD